MILLSFEIFCFTYGIQELNNGSPLPDVIRTYIVQLTHNGVLPSDISRCLHVSNRCVSEILARSIEGLKSRVVETDVIETIAQYKHETPSIFAWKIRNRLLEENICNSENMPSLSSINQVLTYLESKSIDTETTSNTNSTPEDPNSEYEQQINNKNHQDLGDDKYYI
ncbi:unnamed protein product [Rotaria sp. Silwood2]|nr:unnamed protein product [Rotaria sp. Silwood2]CAF3112294.1 unnamed protein product [Rotaria sp. Silwood2]CAF4200270.1 unnamed protein product [Rotaria sp. Silwood2]CAF4420801.1 unnamed protein product [Rotaria sp. Silwood2]